MTVKDHLADIFVTRGKEKQKRKWTVGFVGLDLLLVVSND
jgi:hypothetical protein